MPASSPSLDRSRVWVSLAVAGLLLLVLWLHLLGAVLCAAASYAVYRRVLTSWMARRGPRHAALGALVFTLLVFAAIALACVAAVREIWGPNGGLPGLLQLIADTLAQLRSNLPPWIASRLPDSGDDLQHQLAEWLRENAHSLQHWGREALRVVAHLVVGFAIGLLAAFERTPAPSTPWLAQAREALEDFTSAFADIVAAQGRIAAANAVFTGIFVLLVLPLFGVRLPLATTLVVFTFVAGWLPIVGNLASSSAIVLVALAISAQAAVGALVFLVALHKLEYFLNAHFVGVRTRLPAPVLLAAMLVLEAAFGVAGLVAAPVYAAWVLRRLDAERMPGST
jgi:predicted PurR-regulated permease PerM